MPRKITKDWLILNAVIDCVFFRFLTDHVTCFKEACIFLRCSHFVVENDIGCVSGRVFSWRSKLRRSLKCRQADQNWTTKLQVAVVMARAEYDLIAGVGNNSFVAKAKFNSMVWSCLNNGLNCDHNYVFVLRMPDDRLAPTPALPPSPVRSCPHLDAPLFLWISFRDDFKIVCHKLCLGLVAWTILRVRARAKCTF